MKFPCGKLCGNCDCIDDCGCYCNICSSDPRRIFFEKAKKIDKVYLKELASKLNQIKDYNEASIKEVVGKIDAEKGFSIRAALLGDAPTHSRIFQIIEALGKEESVYRLNNLIMLVR